MKNAIKLLVVGALVTPTLANATYPETTFRCKNRDGLPENTYTIRNVTIDGARIPFVEAIRYYREDNSRPDAPVASAKVSGLAAVSEGKTTMLMVAALKLEFEDNKLIGCK